MVDTSPSPEAAERERTQVPARWIDTIRFTLADIITRGEWDDFGLFRILNRISFVCKNHLIFVVVFRTPLSVVNQKNRSDSFRASPLISSLDPEFFDRTFARLHDMGLTRRSVTYHDFLKYHTGKTKVIKDDQADDLKIILNEALAPDYAIQIWGSQIFVIVMELHVEKVIIGERPNLALSPVTVSSQLGSFISQILLPFDGREGESETHPEFFSSRMYFPKNSSEKGLIELRNANQFKIAPRDTPTHLSKKERDLIFNTLKDVNDIVDDEYNRLKLSPLLNYFAEASDSYNYRSTPNMLFIGKVFNSETIRYSNYKYNSQVIITDTQRRDIVEMLSSAKRADYIPFDKGATDNRFWAWASTAKGRQHIVDMACQPTPANVRLFAESVLMSGTTLIKPRVFERGAIGWISSHGSPSVLSDARDHLGCIHFLLQLGSPVRPVDAKELSLVALPFRCSGGIWMCAVYVRENSSGPIEGVIDQKSFEENILIYHSLFREAERRLRRRARSKYIDALGKLIAQATVETRIRHGDDAILCLDEAAGDSFTRNMRLLTRVYPFDGLTLLTPFHPQEVIRFTDILFGSEPNGFFDRLTLHEFLGEEESVKRLRERVLLASVMRDNDIED